MVNDLGLVYTYYNEPRELKRQLFKYWMKYTGPLTLIVVDDGSQSIPAEPIIRPYLTELPSSIDFQLWRVTQDIGFNSHGCRNLAAYKATNAWLMFLDIDRTLEPSQLYQLQHETEFSREHFYVFFMKAYFKRDTRGIIRASRKIFALNQFIIHREDYLSHGGYNESYVPFHTGDREYLRELEQQFIRTELPDIILKDHRGGRETIIDDTLKMPIYDNKNMILRTPRPNYKTMPQITTKLNFPYERVI